MTVLFVASATNCKLICAVKRIRFLRPKWIASVHYMQRAVLAVLDRTGLEARRFADTQQDE